jgi:type III secretion system FlhB-like substrate exporter
VIITNPTHYAVALSYERGMSAPVCVAKGVDTIALKIREVAGEHDIPIVENVPLARALYATVEIDDEIPVEHYHAVAEIIGYGISTDNHHLTQPHPSGSGPLQAMQRALESADLPASAIDYINAHGTATPFNDAAEGKAIAQLFSKSVPVSSTKGMMGHSLGGAGAIEAVIAILALQDQLLPPNINFQRSDPGINLNIVANEPRSARLQTVLSNSFGFGGANASVIIRSLAA